MTKNLRILLLSGQNAQNIPFRTEKFIRTGKETAADLMETIGNFSGDFIFFPDENGEKPLPQLLELMRENPDLTLAEVRPSRKKHPLPLPDAVLTGGITPHLEGKLIRVSALKTALKLQDAAGPFNELASLAILTALPGTALPGKKRVPAISLPAADSSIPLRERASEYARFSAFANALPRDEKNAVTRRIYIDSVLYRMIVREIRPLPDRDLAAILPDLTGTIDDRLLYYALWWFRRPLLAGWHPAVSKLSPAPVRHLALFCAYLRNGGAERCAVLLSDLFVEMGLKVTFFTLESATEQDYPHTGSAERIVLPKEPHLRRAVLAEELQKRAIDTCVFFDHAEHWTMNDILGARAAGVRTIAMEHSAYAYPWFTGIPDIALERDCVYPAADVVTALSRADRTAWRTCGIRHCVYLPNPLTFPAGQTTDRKPPAGSMTWKNLIFAGRLTDLKGADKALDVLSLVQKKHPDARLLLAGRSDSPEYDKFLREKAEKNGISDAVKFTGVVKDMAKFYPFAAIHLMLSGMEGFPMTLMEAKSFSIPTVLFALPYLESAKEEFGCIQVPQGDVRAMADAVIRLLDNPRELARLGMLAHDSLELFSMKSLRRRWKQIFDFLETGNDPDGIFAEKESPEELLKLYKINQRTLEDAWRRCLEHPEFLRHASSRALEAYFRVHPLLHCLDRAGRIFPKISFRRLSVFVGKTRLKKWYRKIRPQHDTSGREEFPE